MAVSLACRPRAKVQKLQSLREEMKAVARRERPARPDAAKASFNSVEAVVRLLTPDNRRLLALIRDRKPKSVAELVEMTGRAQPNLTRTLAKLEAAGFIRMKTIGRRKAPCVADRLAPPPPTFQSMETAQFGESEHRCARHCSIQKGVTCQDGRCRRRCGPIAAGGTRRTRATLAARGHRRNDGADHRPDVPGRQSRMRYRGYV